MYVYCICTYIQTRFLVVATGKGLKYSLNIIYFKKKYVPK